MKYKFYTDAWLKLNKGKTANNEFLTANIERKDCQLALLELIREGCCVEQLDRVLRLYKTAGQSPLYHRQITAKLLQLLDKESSQGDSVLLAVQQFIDSSSVLEAIASAEIPLASKYTQSLLLQLSEKLRLQKTDQLKVQEAILNLILLHGKGIGLQQFRWLCLQGLVHKVRSVEAELQDGWFKECCVQLLEALSNDFYELRALCLHVLKSSDQAFVDQLILQAKDARLSQAKLLQNCALLAFMVDFEPYVSRQIVASVILDSMATGHGSQELLNLYVYIVCSLITVVGSSNGKYLLKDCQEIGKLLHISDINQWHIILVGMLCSKIDVQDVIAQEIIECQVLPFLVRTLTSSSLVDMQRSSAASIGLLLPILKEQDFDVALQALESVKNPMECSATVLVFKEVQKVYYNSCSQIRSQYSGQNLLFTLLRRLCNQLALSFKQVSKSVTDNDFAESENFILQSLHIVSALCLRSDLDLGVSAYENSVLFTRVWGWCILYSLDSTNHWKNSTWSKVLKMFAQVTPSLHLAPDKNTYQFQLSESTTKIIKESLLDILERIFGSIGVIQRKTIELHQLIHLVSIYHMEMLRLGTVDTVKRFFLYVKAGDVQMKALVRKLCVKIGDEAMQDSFDNQEAIKLLLTDVLLEVTNEINDSETVLDVAKLILNTAPFLKVNADAFGTALNVLDCLKRALDDDMHAMPVYDYDIIIACIKSNDSAVPSHRKLKIKRGYKYRLKLFTAYKAFMSLWMESVFEVDYTSIRSCFETLLEHKSSMKKFNKHGHYGMDFCAEKMTNCLKDLADADFSSLTDDLKAHFVTLMDHRTDQTLNAEAELVSLRLELASFVTVASTNRKLDAARLQSSLYKAAAVFVRLNINQVVSSAVHDLLVLICKVPLQIFSEESVYLGIRTWCWLLAQVPSLEVTIMTELVYCWDWLMKRNRGIFSSKFNNDQVSRKITYGPPKLVHKGGLQQFAYFMPHLLLIQFLKSHHDIFTLSSARHRFMYFSIVRSTLSKKRFSFSSHTMSRYCILELWVLFHEVIEACSESDLLQEHVLITKKQLYEMFYHLLATTTSWHDTYSDHLKKELDLLVQCYSYMQLDNKMLKKVSSDSPTALRLSEMVEYALILCEESMITTSVWIDPLFNGKFLKLKVLGLRGKSEKSIVEFISAVWNTSPKLAVKIARKYVFPKVQQMLCLYAKQQSFLLCRIPESFQYLIGHSDSIVGSLADLKYLYFWEPLSPIGAICLALPCSLTSPSLVQYRIRSLDSFPSDVIFFYIPQVVQMLRYDHQVDAEQFVLKKALSSPFFAHQVIWNMNANGYRKFNDEDDCVEDDLKPTLERIRALIVDSFAGKDAAFYEREFKFFEKVTGISGLLKPFIRRPKQEKKQKIDEELAQISVDAGVYLPTNPDCIVVDIDYQSGRPLQSHAKAPFMASFKIKKNVSSVPALNRKQSSYESLYLKDEVNGPKTKGLDNDDDDDVDEQWNQVIFKVGDDCRQDLLALQLISAIKCIFADAGLGLYVFPYRIVATAPGQGIIEVVPNSVSRDQMGRQSTNNLYKWFLAKFGEENSLSFQRAREAFIRSLAAYSIIVYILQIKDRHNGNVLIDSHGHIIHIDFGYIFDIAPGGVKFELSPFKLTKEMVEIMGGRNSDDYKLFVDLTVRGFLALRPHCERICQMVEMMLGTGFACFKNQTIQALRSRFHLQLSDAEAARTMCQLINASYRAYSSALYDFYQYATNRIRY